MRVLAIDPGATRSAYAIVDRVKLGPITVTSVGYGDQALLDHVMGALVPDEVVVETIMGYAYEASRVALLVETARVEGWLIHAAKVRGIPCTEVAARDWRRALTGSPTPSDAQIEVLVRDVVEGLGPLGTYEQEHIIDAVGLGAAYLQRGSAFLFSDAAVERVQALEGVLRTKKRLKRSKRQREAVARGRAKA